MREALQIHCVVILDTDDSVLRTYYDGQEFPNYPKTAELEAGLAKISDCRDFVVGHNICGFDLPVIRKLYPDIAQHWPPLLRYLGVSAGPRPLDTYMLSCLLYPQSQEHGLDYWGKALGLEKPVHEDWSALSADMIHRCQQDVLINYKLYRQLTARQRTLQSRTNLDWDFGRAIDLEQCVQQIHAEQEVTGVRYDILKAIKLKEALDVTMEGLKQQIISIAPWKVQNPFTVEVKKPFKQNGGYSKAVLDHFGSEKETDRANIKGPFTRIHFEPLNIDSDQQVKEYLLSLGWEPTEWNVSKKTRKRTSPKLTEDSYASLPPGVGRTIAQYRIAAHRRGLILNRKGAEKGGLWAVKHRGDGRVSAEAYTCGTPTSRYRHKGVVCNIPRPTSPYGKEIRELYCVPKEHTQLGLDLKGIEIRMMGHFAFPYPGGKEFVKMILDGDFHANNGRLWSVSRDDSKPGLYGLCYGCTPPKLAAILGKPISEGEYLYQAFWRSYPALAALRSDLEMMYKRNECLKGLDGRRLDIREDRKLLNTLIQGASAVVFKDWMLRNYNTIVSSNLSWVHQIIAYHDELQYELDTADPASVRSVADCFKDNAVKTGQAFNLNVPIEADAKVGTNWAECH